MNTDWPGHLKYNRHATLPISCGAELWFTQGQQPPFAYHLNPFLAANPIWWIFTQFPHYIGCVADPLLARWIRSVESGDNVEIMSMRFNTEGDPPYIRAHLRADHLTSVQTSSAENSIDTGIPEGDFVPRNHVFLFPNYNWIELTNFPLDQGIPSVTIEVSPIDCIPGWSPTEPIP